MAVGETIVTVVGNVMSDPTRRTVGNGHEITSFWMRSNERRFDKETKGWVDGNHLSVKVTCWRRLAETVHSSLHRGDPVIVSGRLHTSDYEVDGQPRSVPELEALAVGPNLSWCTAQVRRYKPRAEPPEPAELGQTHAEPEVGRTPAGAFHSEPVAVG
ncbi:single-stranded DNA-binding protein [Amycolatopsis anabasis]|uniref:single-stranded DNA-binding protein n=1 Tax=Amycolatopsis anabasis TaxID=1840409 RepID=UPI00131E431B|nr:single-stranded DNA-binding protein [Amycolatopsis anabasis]